MKKLLPALAALSIATGAPMAVSPPPPAGQAQTRGALSSATGISLDVTGMGTASVSVAGTYSGTITFYVSNGADAVGVDCFTPDAPSTAVNSTTSTGTWICPVAGMRTLEARMTSYTSGTANITLLAAPGGGSGGGGGAGGGGDATAANQTTQITHLSAIQSASEGTKNNLDTLLSDLAVDAVHDNAAPTGGPQMFAVASATAPTAVSTDLDAVRIWADLSGRLQLNTSQINGVAPSMGAGGTGTGVQRVIEANDSQLSADIALVKSYLAPSTIHYRTSAGATEDEFEVKATAGVLTGGIVTNTAATVSYLKCSNLTAANTTPGSSAVIFGVAIPGATTGAGFNIPVPPGGLTFSTALTCYLVKGAADTDVAEVGANEVKVNLYYR